MGILWEFFVRMKDERRLSLTLERDIMKPHSDFMVENLRAVALKGGEYGPLFDQGVLSIINQIDETGSFVPGIAAILIDMQSNPKAAEQCYTPEERAEALALTRERGWTLEEGVEFGKGVFHALTLLRGYLRKD
jgi:hypothetical protein